MGKEQTETDENESIESGAFNPDEIEVINELPDIADNIIESMSEPTESAIEAHDNAAGLNPPSEPPVSGGDAFIKDVDGNSFNKDIHQVDAEGKPRIGKNGLLMKKRGRKKGATYSGHQSTIGGGAASSGSLGEPVLSEAQKQQAAVTGVVAASVLINVSMMIGGEDFAPVKNTEHGIDEKKALESGFTDYFIATGKTDFPPAAALVLVVSMYVMPRLTKPKVKTHLKEKGSRIYNWWQNRKLKKGKKADASRSNTGNDGKRENDTSEAPSANLQK